MSLTVEVTGLSKRYPEDVTALAGIDLTVAAGECVVLLGPSGCGKTTLLRCLAGLEEPSDGVIRLEGRDMRGVEPRQRPVGLVFQDFALYPHKRVAENITLGLRTRGWDKQSARERLLEVARLLRIEDLLERFPAQLSGGQKQRVGIGRALARRPRVLLMDEPLSNLDTKLRHDLRRELELLRRELRDTAIVYVTHDQAEAMSLGDRLVILEAGTLVQSGTGRELYQQPVNRFVGEFLGDPPLSVLSLPNGLFLGLRPEVVNLDSQEGASLGEATLLSVAEYGHETLARYETHYGEVVARLPASRAPQPCSLIGFSAQDALFFDSSGRRVPAGEEHALELLGASI